MSGGPNTVPEIELPDWHGQPFPAQGTLLERIGEVAGNVGDKTAKGADFGSLFGLPGGIMDAVGGVATAVNQLNESTAQNPALKILDAGIAGAIDVAMGMTPLGPILPAADSAISALGITSPGDLINALVRGGITKVESFFSGNKEGVETFKAKALTGEYGSLFKRLFGG